MALPTAVILLAAGSSSRLGRPKQLLPFGGGTLLRHAAQTALAAQVGPVMVVLGAVAERCRESLSGLPVIVIANPAWSEGMGTSIACGARMLDEGAHRAVIITLCDQPAITSDMLRRLDDFQRVNRAAIVASRHRDILGPPAIFSRALFDELRLLSGLHGAKAPFRTHANTGFVDCPQAALDIDTEADLAALAAC